MKKYEIYHQTITVNNIATFSAAVMVTTGDLEEFRKSIKNGLKKNNDEDRIEVQLCYREVDE